MKTVPKLADAEAPIEPGTVAWLGSNDPVKVIQSRSSYEHEYLVEYADGGRGWRSDSVVSAKRYAR